MTTLFYLRAHHGSKHFLNGAANLGASSDRHGQRAGSTTQDSRAVLSLDGGDTAQLVQQHAGVADAFLKIAGRDGLGFSESASGGPQYGVHFVVTETLPERLQQRRQNRRVRLRKTDFCLGCDAVDGRGFTGGSAATNAVRTNHTVTLESAQ